MFRLIRIILKGRAVLEKGLAIAVSNGVSTNFWLDEWLPCGALIDYANQELSDEELRKNVRSYYEAGGLWNMNLLQQLLPHHIVSMITTIWISPQSRCEDSYYWKASSDGSFSAKTAYHLQFNNTGSNVDCKWVWQLGCALKVKVFLWRVINQALPTCELLASRNIIPSSLCQVCNSNNESILHALRDCFLARTLWDDLLQNSHHAVFYNSNLNDWIKHNCCDKSAFCEMPWNIIFAHTVWFLWYWRNCSFFDASFSWPTNAIQQVLTKAKEAHDVFSKFEVKLRYEALVGWTRPLPSFIKINVDGSTRGHLGSSTAGGVIRDMNGTWLRGFTCRVGIATIMAAELWAIFHGLNVAWDLGFRCVVIESDSLAACKKIRQQMKEADPYQHLINAIKELLSRDWNCTLKHVLREANSCADWMATHFDNLPLGLHVFDVPPRELWSLLLADSLGVA